eukprot:scpid24419/ scgid14090/ Protein NLRC3
MKRSWPSLDSGGTQPSKRSREATEREAGQPFPVTDQVRHGSLAQHTQPPAQSRPGSTAPCPSTAERTLPEAVLQLRASLQRVYLRQEYRLRKTAAYAERTFPIDQICTSLLVVCSEDLYRHVHATTRRRSSTESQSQSACNDYVEPPSHTFRRASETLPAVPLADIFTLEPWEYVRGVELKKTVYGLALSSAGAGKTMLFARKGPHDWARGLLWKEFDVVVAVEMRSQVVCRAQCIEQLLALEMHGVIGERDQRSVLEHVRDYPERVCVILDGLNEVGRLDECSEFINDVITGAAMPGIRLLITSRHTPTVAQLVDRVRFNRCVEVIGFSEGAAEQYIQLILPLHDAVDLVDRVNANPHLGALVQMPFVADALCKRYRCRISLPDSLGDVCLFLVLCILQQQHKSIVDAKPQYVDWSSVSGSDKEAVAELGFFAFRMLARGKTVFAAKDLASCMVSAATAAAVGQSLGMLVMCESESSASAVEWRFSHAALQETLAAYYISRRPLSVADARWLVQLLGPLGAHVRTFWLLVATALPSECMDVVLEAILHAAPQESTNSRADGIGAQGHTVVHFLLAGPAALLNWTDHLACMLPRDDVAQLAVRLLDDKLADGFGSPSLAVAAMMRNSALQTDRDLLCGLLHLWVKLVPSANTQLLYEAIADFAPGLASRCFASTPTPRLALCHRRITVPAPTCRQRRLLFACRCFAEHAGSGHRARDVASFPLPSLVSALEQYGLDFISVGLTLADCSALGTVLQLLHRHIRKVDLRDSDIGDEGYRRLASGLALTQGLTDLFLGSNALSDSCAGHIATVIESHADTLLRLGTAGNPCSSEGFTALHSHTDQCSRLRGLALGGSCSTHIRENVRMLTVILRACTQLKYLNLYGYVIGDAGLAELEPLLERLELHALALNTTGLTPHSAPTVQCILQHQASSLECLSIGGQALRDGYMRRGAMGVHDALTQCRHLTRVWLPGNGFTAACLRDVSSLLPCWPELKGLTLCNNDLRADDDVHVDDGIGVFAKAVQAAPSLTLLEMPEEAWLSAELHAQLCTGIVRAGNAEPVKVRFTTLKWFGKPGSYE